MAQEKFPVAKHLNVNEYLLLLKVYAAHNRSMGLEKRKKYTLSNIVKVEKNIKENCLNVHYDNGDWWHYSANGTWY
ncbi:hypothetical protein [Bacillus sp. 1P02SD]|uniref:hypothetical protein n=1 Tax=Bacillus sp. 1P02SD TaxID=3132264 RepID=UPI00399FE7A1